MCGINSKSTPPLTDIPATPLTPPPGMLPSGASFSPKPSNDSPSDNDEHCDFWASTKRQTRCQLVRFSTFKWVYKHAVECQKDRFIVTLFISLINLDLQLHNFVYIRA